MEKLSVTYFLAKQQITKCFTEPKKRHSQVNKGVLYFVPEKCSKGMPLTGQAKQLKTRDVFLGRLTRDREGWEDLGRRAQPSLWGLQLPCLSC